MSPFLSQVVSVPELFLVSVQLTHDKTGAQHLHVARDDSNNVFRYKLYVIYLVFIQASLRHVFQSAVQASPSRNQSHSFVSKIRNC